MFFAIAYIGILIQSAIFALSLKLDLCNQSNCQEHSVLQHTCLTQALSTLLLLRLFFNIN